MQVVKENQVLHKGTRIIDDEVATLADMNIFPGDKLWVNDSEIHENRDIAGNFMLLVIWIFFKIWCLGNVCSWSDCNALANFNNHNMHFILLLIFFYTDELSDQKMDVQHTEEGFRGTLLTANVSSQVV